MLFVTKRFNSTWHLMRLLEQTCGYFSEQLWLEIIPYLHSTQLCRVYALNDAIFSRALATYMERLKRQNNVTNELEIFFLAVFWDLPLLVSNWNKISADYWILKKICCSVKSRWMLTYFNNLERHKTHSTSIKRKKMLSAFYLRFILTCALDTNKKTILLHNYWNTFNFYGYCSKTYVLQVLIDNAQMTLQFDLLKYLAPYYVLLFCARTNIWFPECFLKSKMTASHLLCLILCHNKVTPEFLSFYHESSEKYFTSEVTELLTLPETIKITDVYFAFDKGPQYFLCFCILKKNILDPKLIWNLMRMYSQWCSYIPIVYAHFPMSSIESFFYSKFKYFTSYTFVCCCGAVLNNFKTKQYDNNINFVKMLGITRLVIVGAFFGQITDVSFFLTKLQQKKINVCSEFEYSAQTIHDMLCNFVPETDLDSLTSQLQTILTQSTET